MRTTFLATVALLFVLTLASCAYPPTSPPPATAPTPSPASSVAPTPPSPGTSTPSPTVSSGVAWPNISEIVPRITPSVVSIQTQTIDYDIFLRPFPEEGAGTGIIIDSSGYILTNNHVVDGADRITVTLNDQRTFDAVDVRQDPQTDTAIVKIDAAALTAAKLGDSSSLRVGDWVVAVGNALALEGGPTVTAGIVSYLGRSIQVDANVVLYDLIQTDAPINPGNSGGPLLNLSGEVVGINTAIAGEAQNIGFSIAITPALPIIESLISTGYVPRPTLGVSTMDATPSLARRYGLAVRQGALVTAVSAAGPADREGIRSGDIITRFGGQDISSRGDLVRATAASQAGQDIEVTYYRGSSQRTARVTLGRSGPVSIWPAGSTTTASSGAAVR